MRRMSVIERWYFLLPLWSIPLFAALAIAKYRGVVFHEEPHIRWFVAAFCGCMAYGLSAFWVCHLLDRSRVTGGRKALWWGIALLLYGIGPTIVFFLGYQRNQQPRFAENSASSNQEPSQR